MLTTVSKHTIKQEMSYISLINQTVSADIS